jgi:hypothetical protein
MNQMKFRALAGSTRRHLGTISLCIIAVILIAGLWPRNFNFKNEAALLPDGNGIRFSGKGMAYSRPLPLNRNATFEPGSFSIEMAIQADREWRRYLPVIFALDGGTWCERLIVGQWRSSLIIRSRRESSCKYVRSREIGVRDLLLPGKTRFIGISSGAEGTAVYADGQLKVWRKDLSLLNPGETFNGSLIVGTSADGKLSWTGTMSSFSLYDRSLSPEESLQHYEDWRDSGRALPEDDSSAVAAYLFDEQEGRIVKDHSGQGNDLLIPERFTPLRHSLLIPPWIDFHPSLSYAQDAAINITGFIPFGFFLSWYLSARGMKRRNVLLAVMVLGAGSSLFIEFVQSYLPARSSQLSDLITNTSGTAIGIFLWSRFIHHLLPSQDSG